VALPRVRDLLYRFRPSGAPGAATAAGVPVDHAARLAAELEPVFARLAATERECAAVLAEGRRRAEDLRRLSEERAQALIAGAEVRAEAERAASATATREAGRAVVSADQEAAERWLVEMAARARARFPEYLALVEDAVAAVLAGPSPDEPGARPGGGPS
jgi:hypothetical protein